MKTIVLYTAFLIAGHAKALTGVYPPLAFARDYGNVIFTMVPRQYSEENKMKKAFGVAYQLQWDGSLKELYRTEDWYSSEVFISDNGKYLVRMGDIGSGNTPRKEDLAVAFYQNGKLIKEYSTADLVTDNSKIVPSDDGGYVWRYQGPRKDNGEISDLDLQRFRLHLDRYNNFKLFTIDGWTYTFDSTTGKIKAREKTDG